MMTPQMCLRVRLPILQPSAPGNTDLVPCSCDQLLPVPREPPNPVMRGCASPRGTPKGSSPTTATPPSSPTWLSSVRNSPTSSRVCRRCCPRHHRVHLPSSIEVVQGPNQKGCPAQISNIIDLYLVRYHKDSNRQMKKIPVENCVNEYL